MRPVAFDFDGTLSESEMVVLLAEAAGVRFSSPAASSRT
jgi:phosphoserine phosphatase